MNATAVKQFKISDGCFGRGAAKSTSETITIQFMLPDSGHTLLEKTYALLGALA